MSHSLTRLRSGRAMNWRTVVGLVLVPLTVAGLMLWGLWKPQDRLSEVTAAVVNLDEPVEVDGQTVPLGRVLAAELIGDDTDENFEWVLTDEDDAANGLDEGRYATVITIPENFSSAATSLSDGPDEAEQATVDIATSERGRLLDTALSGIVTQTATNVLNQQLGEQFVGNIFVGMSELHSGIGEAADGTEQLAAGGDQLADGASELADGTEQFADGTEQLASGAGELANGAGELASGAGDLATGTEELSNGTGELASGVKEYVKGASKLADSYEPLGSGAADAAKQLQQLIAALEQVGADAAEPQQQLSEGLAAAGAGAQGLVEDIEGLGAECVESGASAEFCEELTGTLQTHAGEIGSGIQTARSGAEGLGGALEGLGGDAGSGGDPVKKLDALITGLDQFGTGLDTFAEQGAKLVSGASDLSDGASQLASGTGALSSGASELAGGTSQLANGTSELASGAPELADGASQLADGARQSADGAQSLADGLGEATQEIPNYTEAERDRMASMAVAPVDAEGGDGELFNAAGVPLFVAIALWAGALAAFLMLAPLWRRTRDAARGVAWIALRSAAPAAAIGAVQGAAAGILLPRVLGYDLGQSLAFLGIGVLAGVAFALVAQGLSALLGGVGRFLAFALLVLAFTVGVVATVPSVLQTIGDSSPIGAAYAGFQSIAAGSLQLTGTVWALILWAAAGVVLTAFGVMRARSKAR